MVCNANMIGTCKSFLKVFLTSMGILDCPKTKRTLKDFFIPVKHVCGLASLVTLYFRAWNELKKLLYHLIVQCLNLFRFKGFPKILKIHADIVSVRPPCFFERILRKNGRTLKLMSSNEWILEIFPKHFIWQEFNRC